MSIPTGRRSRSPTTRCGPEVTSGIVALIPARAGSKRIPGKNLRPLGSHPLLAYSVCAALESGAFERVVVSTDDDTTAAVARRYGAEVPFRRPAHLAVDTSPDVDWVRHAVEALEKQGQRVRLFSIQRPTSPLRSAGVIAAAVEALLADETADSLRAVERVAQHPGKMWVVDEAGARMRPFLDDLGVDPPWHSSPYQVLPVVHVQNASLEVARVRCLEMYGTIAGKEVVPWVMPGYEGLDLNNEIDWIVLEALLERGEVTLPMLPYPVTGPTSRS